MMGSWFGFNKVFLMALDWSPNHDQRILSTWLQLFSPDVGFWLRDKKNVAQMD